MEQTDAQVDSMDGLWQSLQRPDLSVCEILELLSLARARVLRGGFSGQGPHQLLLEKQHSMYSTD